MSSTAPNYPSLRIERDQRGVVLVVLNRPEVHNAFNAACIADIGRCFRDLSLDASCRVVILGAEGPSFCAGADLQWMRAAAQFTEAQNLADAAALADMLDAIYTCPKPVIARVQGHAYGGGIGVIAACDVAIGVHAAKFSLSEAKLGLAPSTISPYVIEAIGARNARRYFLTAERMNASEAYRIGLLHDLVLDEIAMDEIIAQLANLLLANGPTAMAESKSLIRTVSNRPIDATLRGETAAHISRLRTSPEGREGVTAFLEKRAPGWVAADSAA